MYLTTGRLDLRDQPPAHQSRRSRDDDSCHVCVPFYPRGFAARPRPISRDLVGNALRSSQKNGMSRRQIVQWAQTRSDYRMQDPARGLTDIPKVA
jgi:hypothetical protein